MHQLAYRHAAHHKIAALAEIGLHQNAQRILPGADFKQPGRDAGAAFELIGDHSITAPDIAFGDLPRPRGIKRINNVSLCYVKAVDIVQNAVICLSDDRHNKIMLR